MVSHAVVRTDKMHGTDVRAGLVSVQYLGVNGETPTAIENGNVLKLEGLKKGEREVFVGKAVAASDPISDIVLVATPEVIYDDLRTNLDAYTNEPGTICRGYRFHDGDIFSVTKNALTGLGEPAVGDVVELAAGTKLGIAKTASGGATTVGTIIAIDYTCRYTFYVIKVTIADEAAATEPTPPPVGTVPEQKTSDFAGLGKSVSELVGADIRIDASGAVTGTLHYISEWTAFSPLAEENTGNFFPLKLGSAYGGKTISCKRDGVVRNAGAVDLNWVLFVPGKDTVFTFECEGETILTLTFKDAKFDQKG